MLKQVQHDIFYYFPVTTQSFKSEVVEPDSPIGERVLIPPSNNYIPSNLAEREGFEPSIPF